MLTSLTITAGQKTEETEAAEKFVTFMEQADNIADWVMMSPGAALPVNKAVVTTATWKDNDVIKALGELPNQLIGELPNIQVFGAVGDKNFTRMGDVTGSGVVSSMVHNVTVGKADLSTTLQASQKKLDELIRTALNPGQESAMNRLFSGRSDMPFALLLSRPAYYCWAVWWRGRWCRISKSVFYVCRSIPTSSQRLLG